MKTPSVGIISIFFLIIFIPTMVGCNQTQSEQRSKARTKMAPKSKKSAQLGEAGHAEHPYGRPFKGALLWEKDLRFKKAMADLKMGNRLAAFQTTLPDPLPGEEANVALAADYLAGIVVKPGETFSMNRMIGPYSKARGFREGPAYYGPKVVKVTGGRSL